MSLWAHNRRREACPPAARGGPTVHEDGGRVGPASGASGAAPQAPGCRLAALRRLAVAVLLPGGLALAPPACAQAGGSALPGHGVSVSLHLHCFSGVEAVARSRMEYWSRGLARHNPDPDCVARDPLMAPLPLLSVDHAWHADTETERVRLHVDPGYRAAIARITAAHRGQVVAVAVYGRLVTTIWLTGPLEGAALEVHAADRQAGMDLARDLRDLMRVPARP